MVQASRPPGLRAEMKMGLVLWNRLVQVEAFIHID
jgi:hypothetical protein